jgi:uncharacterized protein YjbI with pentapeptide repeats
MRRLCSLWLSLYNDRMLQVEGPKPFHDFVASWKGVGTLQSRFIRLAAAAAGGILEVGFIWGLGLLLSLDGATNTIVAALVGGGGIISVLLGYRSHRLAQATDRREEGKLFNERFGAAAAQLGSERYAVRLAGIYAMAALADDWSEGRQQCVDVLCSNVRRARMPEPEPTAKRKSLSVEYFASQLAWKNDEEFRHEMIRIIRDHLTGESEISWSDCSVNFSGAVFNSVDFSDSQFRGKAYFLGTLFKSSTHSFARAKLWGPIASFASSVFSGAWMDFQGSWFAGEGVSFNNTHFKDGEVCFAHMVLEGKTASFRHSTFSGGEIVFYEPIDGGGVLDFSGANFNGSAVRVRLSTARVSIEFCAAHFSSGSIDFELFKAFRINFMSSVFGGSVVSVNIGSPVGRGRIILIDSTFSSGKLGFICIDSSDLIIDFRQTTLEGGRLEFDYFRASPSSLVFSDVEKMKVALALYGGNLAIL